MSRKLLILLMVSLFVVSSAMAVPSKTTNDLVNTMDIISSTGVAIRDDFKVSVIKDETVDAEVSRIFQFVSSGGKLMDYFSDDVIKQITDKLPSGFDLSSLKMNEIFAIEILNYDDAYGDLIISFSVASEYEDGQSIIALVGIDNGMDEMEWIALDAVVEDGLIKVTFPLDVLELMEGASVALAILS